jgi:uncharacterized protein YbbC (DUF1343 family)
MRLFLLSLMHLLPMFLSAQIIVRSRQNIEKTDADIRTGAERTEMWLPKVQGKKVAVIANHASLIGTTHLVDSMLALKVNVVKIFSPEHGFRGDADAGAEVKNGKDQQTGLPVISLYGEHKKPTEADLKGIDVVVFDLQDVGVRFFTYISTMTYAMEACAEQKKTFLILDRPNPNGYYVDGPIMENANKSFVGLHPVPVVHGMTVAEYARMVNGEKWLAKGVMCDLQWVICESYTHSDWYQLPVKPSPNLPNMAAVYLYPSLCLFEGTLMSIGRGTDFPFQVVGHPELQNADFTFSPKPRVGAIQPLYEGMTCYGHDLRSFATLYVRDYKKLYLFWLMGCYKDIPNRSIFFNDYFIKLAGTSSLKEQIISGKSEEQIRQTWESGIVKYKVIRKKYLLYDDFE